MVSLCMIARDEAFFIGECLKSIKDYVDDMVVVDTGSVDQTKAIALEHGARVFDFKWCGDFAAARNFAAGLAACDWIIVLDADETLRELNRESLDRLMQNPLNIGAFVLYSDFDMITQTFCTRIYNRNFAHFEGTIHEQLRPVDRSNTLINEKISMLVRHHIDDPKSPRFIKKYERNKTMLEQALAESPDNVYLQYQLGKNYAYQNVDTAKACEIFERAMSYDLDYGLEYVQRLVLCYGYALINSGQYRKSLCMLDYFDYYSGSPDFRFLLGHVYMNNGMMPEAMDFFESCIGDGGIDISGITSFMSYYNIGVIFECMGQKNEAREFYEKCGNYQPAAEGLRRLNI